MPCLDLIIPLGVGSKFDNDELRLCLRSAELHAVGLQRVVIVTQAELDWLTNVTIIRRNDPLKKNKDGNMIDKVLLALNTLDIKGDFMLCADDNLFMQDVVLEDCPMIYNSKKRSDFNANGKRWHRRMVRTFDYLASRGIHYDYNYEVHAPQRFCADLIRERIKSVDYRSDIGYGIYTLFRGISDEHGGETQSKFKTTHESIESVDAPLDRMFANYNDDAFKNGFRKRLFSIFNTKSKYEK